MSRNSGWTLVLVLFFTSALLSRCYYGTGQASTPSGSLPHSEKGYELYSWQDEEDGTWRYMLVTGTNRLKTAEELTSEENTVSDDGWVKMTVTGVGALSDLLGRLPAGEQLFWRSEGWMPPEGAAAGQFRLPEQSVIATVEQRCQDLDLHLTVNAARAPAGTRQAEPPPMQLGAVLEMPQTLPNGAQVELTFTLTNYAAHPLYVLKWYTPLEGVAGEIFRVERNGQMLPYQGILAMRGDPGPEDYILLQPGGSAAATVNLADAYDFSQAGSYTIKFISPRISHVARTKAGMARTVNELGPVKILSNTVTVTVGTGDGS